MSGLDFGPNISGGGYRIPATGGYVEYDIRGFHISLVHLCIVDYSLHPDCLTESVIENDSHIVNIETESKL